MSITGAVVMFAVFWFIALFLVLPHGQSTQLEEGEVEPGTPGGAPSEINMKRKFLYATIGASVALAIFAVIVGFELLTLDDFDFLYPESFKEPHLGER